MVSLQGFLLIIMVARVYSKASTPRTSVTGSSVASATGSSVASATGSSVASATGSSVASANISEQFPNPRTDFLLCNRKKPSYICDPDRILDIKQADKLDLFANDHFQSTPCLCSRCSKNDGGVPIGVLLKYNSTINVSDTNAIANRIREKWKLGKCTNDIIILVFADYKKSGFSMGQTVQHPLPSKLATKVFNDCAGHFENDNYYQGLESMINSFRDVLRRFQKLKPLPAKKKTGLIIGIAAGVVFLVAMVLVAAIIRCRQIRRRVAKGKPTSNRDYSGLENISSKYSYNLYSDPAKKDAGDSSSSSSDEGIASDGEDGGHKTKPYNLVNLTIPPKFTSLRGRQLSDVMEETQEEDEATAIKYAMTNTPRNCHINVTEL